MQRIRCESRVLQKQPSLLEVTEESLNNYNPDSHPCQRCGKNIWGSRTSGSYSRYMSYINNGVRNDDIIKVSVAVCSQCGKSDQVGEAAEGDYYHTVLPDTLLPFTAYTLQFVLHVLKEYTERTCTVVEVCAKWAIFVSTLYRWKKRYKEQYDAWANSLERIDTFKNNSSMEKPAGREKKALSITFQIVLDFISSLVPDFFSRFRFSFMQPNHLTHLRPLPIKRRC